MKSIYDLIVPNGEQPYDAEVVALILPDEKKSVFLMDIEVWPDLYQYSGPRVRKRILAQNAQLVAQVEKADILGYSVRNIRTNDLGDFLQIDTGIRRLELRVGSFEIT